MLDDSGRVLALCGVEQLNTTVSSTECSLCDKNVVCIYTLAGV